MKTITIPKSEYEELNKRITKLENKINNDNIHWNLAAEKSLKEVWDNKEDEIWNRYLENESM